MIYSIIFAILEFLLQKQQKYSVMKLFFNKHHTKKRPPLFFQRWPL